MGTERRAEGAPRSTDLQDPKEAEDTARPLNALWKRLSEDGISRKVRPFPGSRRGDTAYAGTHTPVLMCTHTCPGTHTHGQAHMHKQARAPRVAGPGHQPSGPGQGQQRASQGLRAPRLPDSGAKAGPGNGLVREQG